MTFPDQTHLHQLQEDLWQWPSSRAAVMVGAGFSLNTEPLPGVKSRFPTWRQLVWPMFDELYPISGNETHEQKEKRKDGFNGMDALRLASEYEAAFGRRKLELLIRHQNPDTEHLPGQLHELLLQLPWKDVFTTNYDTLLERTLVSGRAYQPVTTANELTAAFSPRIIKLHGSFPSSTPFIITEEDYRTYTRLFAPFVNTVQQALIENSLVLVGFSGDDPNFLQWIGWIRDHLGDRHAPIYLVGPLRLSNAQRSLLERRGVTPIDLSPVFSGLKPAKGNHAASLEWFFRSLLAAKPTRFEKWPEDDSFRGLGINNLPSIIGARKEEPPMPIRLSPEGDKPLGDEEIEKLISRWSYERNQYPGWLVASQEMRFRLWTRTRFWIEPMTQFISSWPSVDRVLAVRELHWRYEVSMVPLLPELIKPIEASVVDLYEDLVSGSSTLPSTVIRVFRDASQQDIVEAWLELAFGLLRAARENFDSSRWNDIKQKINAVVAINSVGEDRCFYEEALWRVSNLERIRAKEILAGWSPSLSFPLAAMWKAGLLAELDELEEARSLLRSALSSTRNALLRKGQNIELLSIEGWCTYLLFSIEHVVDTSSRSSVREEFGPRWSELRAWDCDPWITKGFFNDVLDSPSPSLKQSGKTVVRNFDAGEQQIFFHWSSDQLDSYLPAFAYLRLFEQIGMPMRLPLVNIGGDILGNACQWVAPFIGYWSPAILVRAGKIKDLKKDRFLSRIGIAAMQEEGVKQLHQWAYNALKRELQTLSGRIDFGSSQESLLEILPELLSRLAFRLNQDGLEDDFRLGLNFHKSPGIRSHIRLHEVSGSWFKRLFDAASEKQLLGWLPELIRAPYYDDNTPTLVPHYNAWPDPMQDFPSKRGKLAVAFHPDLMSDIRSATDWLLKRADSESGESRQRIFLRLYHIYRAELMTASQISAFGDLLWTDVGNSDLPDVPFYYFSLMHMPSPKSTNVVSLVHNKVLQLMPVKSVTVRPDGSLKFTSGVVPERMIHEVAMGSKPIIQLRDEPKGLIEWSPGEARSLWLRALDWWNNDKALIHTHGSDLPFDSLSTDSILETLNLFDYFLVRAIIPNLESEREEEWRALLDLISEARSHHIFLTMCLPYVLVKRPEHIIKFESEIQVGLSLGSKAEVEACALAVRHWVHLSSLGLIGKSNLLVSLINRVAFRVPEGVSACILQVSWLLVEMPEAFSWDLIQYMIASLVPWHGAVQLPLSKDDAGGFSEYERPDLRALLGRLAGALSKWIALMKPEIDEPEGIKMWRTTCDEDPLPEVHRSFFFWERLDAIPDT